MIISPNAIRAKSPEMRSVTVTTQQGKRKVLKLRKHKPHGCSEVRKICTSCQIKRIHKNSPNFTTGKCSTCRGDKSPPAPALKLIKGEK